MLMFYGGGHGATHLEKQFIMLNSDIADKALIDIQFRLELLADQTTCQISAFFDCCRVELMDQSRYIAEKTNIVKLKEVNFENKAWTSFHGLGHKDRKKEVETIEDWKKKFKDIMELKV